MVRITPRLQRNTVAFNLNRALKNFNDINRKIASAKEVALPSDDPLRFLTGLSVTNSLSENKQFQRNLQDVDRFLKNNEAAVQDVVDVLQHVRTLTIQASNDTLDPIDRQQIAKEMNQLVEELVRQANAKFASGYIFGGTQTGQEPFETVRDADGQIVDVLYRGDTRVIERAVEEGTTVPVNFAGSSLYQAVPQRVEGGLLFDNAADPFANQSGFTPAVPETGVFRINGFRVPFDVTQDSLSDIVSRINLEAAGAGVSASISTRAAGTAGVANPDLPMAAQLPGVTAGYVEINGERVSFDPEKETLSDLNRKLDQLQFKAGVRSEKIAVGADTSLRLEGIQTIAAPDSAHSNVLQLLGITDGSGNLQPAAVEGYRLRLESDQSRQMVLEDEGTGAFLQRLGVINGVGAGPNNIDAGAFNDNRTIFHVLMQLRDALDQENGIHFIRGAALDGIDRTLQSMLSNMADIGARANRVAQTELRLEGFEEEATRVLSEAQDINLATAITDLRLAEVRLSAATQAGQRIYGLNLLQFL